MLERRFGLAAFLIPLGVGAVPEIIVGLHPVGFDAIAFYVPNTLGLDSGEGGLAIQHWNCPERRRRGEETPIMFAAALKLLEA